jgi:tRNA(Ile)-lysidine synthase
MLEQFLNHIDRQRLCERTDSILLAVSGGVDSMAMLYLFKEADFRVGVAHCNFQLRGKESDGDEEFVQQVCKELNVPFFCKRFETEAYAWENTLSIQMAARELRYAWFDELLNGHSYQRMATGHHLDDTMETILLNITRGSSTEGLAGIPAKNGNIIRPLLFATRKEIEKHAIKKGMVWREDLSNLTDDYQRNFIRHQVLPKLKELNPSLEITWQTGIEKIQGDLALLHIAIEEWKGKFVTETPHKISIGKNAFNSFPQGATLLWRYCRVFGFNFEQAKEVLQSLKGQPGKRFFSSSHLLVLDRDFILITPLQHGWTETIIEKKQVESYLGPWTIKKDHLTEMLPVSNEMEAILDEELLSYPLVWRKWKPGDSFHPLGMDHKKKLSDFFIDKKLSLADKEIVTVLELGDRIVWVAGHRIDDRFKLTTKTTSIVRFRLSRADEDR